MVQPSDTSREPCPDRILDDFGGAFAMGAIGGSAFHFVKGLRNSPKGSRIAGGAIAARMNAPRIGGSFGVWGGLFSICDCGAVYMRQKEDPWNSIFSGAATGGLLQMRQGLRSASRSALFGGIFLALIEGVQISVNRQIANAQNMMMEDPAMIAAAWGNMYQPQGQLDLSRADKSSSSFSPWFGGWGKKEDAESDGAKTEILEAFDCPSTPIPTFEY